jgi:hypothetical protein
MLNLINPENIDQLFSLYHTTNQSKINYDLIKIKFSCHFLDYIFAGGYFKIDLDYNKVKALIS